MLWLALHLPKLPLQVFQRATPETAALAIAERRRVLAANGQAQRLGVRADMGLASALAVAPELVLRDRDPDREAATLEEIAVWAGQFTPHVSLDPPAGVLLEVQSGLRLFGGLEALARRIEEGCRELGFLVELAGAPTPLAARWLARAGRPALISEPATLGEALDRLPLDVLECAPEVLEMLLSIGALAIADCRKLPRAGLARRGAHALLDQLDRALGRTPDPRPWFVPPARYAARLELTVPQSQAESLMFVIQRLFAGFSAWLRARHAGVERFTLRLEHEAIEPTLLVITLGGSSRDAVRFALLAREHLARLELVAPVYAVGLEADRIHAQAANSEMLFPGASGPRERVERLVERLRARMGPEAVRGLKLVADHRPERRSRDCEPGLAAGSAVMPGPPRPLWLLREPRRLALREGRPWLEAPLRLVAGPERIEAGWWDEPAIPEARRDYFIASSRTEELLWIYRELDPPEAWYLHGIFA